MSLDALLLSQQAIRNVLIADTDLMATITGVFDFVPEETAFPYLHFGTMQAEPKHNLKAQQHLIRHELWVQDRGRGRANLFGIISKVENQLESRQLTLSGYYCLPLRLVKTQVEKRDSGLSHEAKLQLNLLVQKT